MFYYNNFDFLNKYNIFFFFLYWPKQISLLSKIPENPQYMPVFYPKYFKEILVLTSCMACFRQTCYSVVVWLPNNLVAWNIFQLLYFNPKVQTKSLWFYFGPNLKGVISQLKICGQKLWVGQTTRKFCEKLNPNEDWSMLGLPVKFITLNSFGFLMGWWKKKRYNFLNFL